MARFGGFAPPGGVQRVREVRRDLGCRKPAGPSGYLRRGRDVHVGGDTARLRTDRQEARVPPEVFARAPA